jgi:hypothetical protein
MEASTLKPTAGQIPVVGWIVLCTDPRTVDDGYLVPGEIVVRFCTVG